MRGRRGNDDAGRRGEEGDRRWRLWRSPAMETREGDAQDGSSTGGPSTSTSIAAVSEDGNSEIDEDDDDLDMDELNELEASLSKTSIQIQEPRK
ncbi:hypothetical protein Ccrd_014727 [Cynara cardunculus var. scolymus]|uniref:Uncharacterized protein n=1 Tax=Cynara cardunculus var. scolymus TaxID=59895 RepID=A0A118K448_CYNCS|nr:hypothetical protein Ccrd_014727 [Cynara cardunculus var. scolymus]